MGNKTPNALDFERQNLEARQESNLKRIHVYKHSVCTDGLHLLIQTRRKLPQNILHKDEEQNQDYTEKLRHSNYNSVACLCDYSLLFLS